MVYDTVRSRLVVVHSSAGPIQHDADKTVDGPFECQILGIDDVDAGVRPVGQIVLRTIRIDEADVEGPQRVAGDLDRRQAFGLRVGWGPWARTGRESSGGGERDRRESGGAIEIGTEPGTD